MGSDAPDGSVHPAHAWARSGAMWLTGSPAGPPSLVPWDVAGALCEAAGRLSRLTTELGRPVEIDGPALLGERAAHVGFGRQAWLTVGSAGRMVRAADGWLALQLPRPNDWEALPALIGVPVVEGDWAAVESAVARHTVAALVRDGTDLGMALAALESRDTALPAAPPADPWAVRPRARGTAGGRRSLLGLRVLDLSSLWAGPLCADLLARAGADVTRVEDPDRPDGARRGPKGFYRLLHSWGRDVPVRLTTAEGRTRLAGLIESSDVVIEASRPRALAQMGIDAEQIAPGPLIWLSITGHGRAAHPERVGFGDDAAVAGGLWLAGDAPTGRPWFVGDAIADPMTGLHAALAVAESVAAGGGTLIDISLRGVAAAVAERPVATDDAEAVAEVINDGGEWWVQIAGRRERVARPRTRSAG